MSGIPLSAPTKPLALVGMMGAGKSSVAERISEQTGCLWVDLDHLIERQEGLPISQLFALQGEHAFRDREALALHDLLKKLPVPAVLSTGGGTVGRAASRQMLRRACRVVWLDGPAQLLYDRAASTERPLTQAGFSAFEDLYRQRQASYERAAHWRLSVEGRSADEIAEAIVRWWWPQREEG